METRKDILEDLQLRSEGVQEVLSESPAWMVRWGSLLFLAIICMLIGITYLIKYPEFIPAPIVITSHNPPEKLEARTDSKIEYVLINDHQQVNPGDLLMVLQSTADYKDVLQLKSLMNQVKDKDLSLFPLKQASKFNLGEVQEAYNTFAKSLQDEYLFNKLRPYAPENLAANQSIAEYKRRIVSFKHQKLQEIDKFELTKKNYERSVGLFKRNVISALELETEKMKFLQAQQSLENINISLSQMEESVNNANKARTGAAINAEKDQVNYKTSSAQLFEQLKKTIRDWEQRYLVISSTKGIASFQQFWASRQFVKTGDILLTIIPQDKKMIVGRMFVPAANSGKIIKGEKVLIKLDNFRYQEFGMVTGKVQNISLSPDKNGNYYVEVILPKGLKTSYQRELPFDKELRGNAEIVTEDLRLIERVFNQLRSLLGHQN